MPADLTWSYSDTSHIHDHLTMQPSLESFAPRHQTLEPMGLSMNRNGKISDSPKRYYALIRYYTQFFFSWNPLMSYLSYYLFCLTID